MCSVVRSRNIDSNVEATRCRTSDDFNIFNRHGDVLYPSCLNDETNKMITPLLNMKHDLGIDNNNINNLMSLSNVLILEEGKLSIHLHNDVNTIHLDTTN